MKLSKAKAVFLFFYVLMLVGLGYFTYVAYRSYQLYDHLTDNRNIMTFGVVEADPVLGFAPRADSSGYLLCPEPPDIPYFYDAFRHRIPEHQQGGEWVRPYVLTLGCSFTHGDACFVEDTYAYRLAGKLGGTALNAGFWGYGLAQMLLKGREEIPLRRPEYVVAQYSPWLVERSLTPFPPTRFGKRTTPYFYDDGNGGVALHDPVSPIGRRLLKVGLFSSFPLEKYRGTEKSASSFISFFREIGFPLFVRYSDALVLGYDIGRVTGRYPPPTTNRLAVVQQVYGELADLCRANGAQLIIPFLGAPEKDVVGFELDYVMSLTNGVVVDTYTPLRSQLPDDSRETYYREYAHFRGDPPVMIDGHPNAKAHAVYADEIYRALTGAAAVGGGE